MKNGKKVVENKKVKNFGKNNLAAFFPGKTFHFFFNSSCAGFNIWKNVKLCPNFQICHTFINFFQIWRTIKFQDLTRY